MSIALLDPVLNSHLQRWLSRFWKTGLHLISKTSSLDLGRIAWRQRAVSLDCSSTRKGFQGLRSKIRQIVRHSEISTSEEQRHQHCSTGLGRRQQAGRASPSLGTFM